MRLVNLKFSSAYLLCLQLAINFANPILPEISSSRAELKKHGDLRRSSSSPLGPNIVLIHNFLGNETQLNQDYQASSGNWTSETVMTTSKEMPFLLQGGVFDDTNNFMNSRSQLPTEAPASQQQQSSSSDSPRDRPLVYPSLPHQRQHQPNSTHGTHGTLRETFNLDPIYGYLNYRSISQFGSFNPNLFGFPAISSTRENVGHQINW